MRRSFLESSGRFKRRAYTSREVTLKYTLHRPWTVIYIRNELRFSNLWPPFSTLEQWTIRAQSDEHNIRALNQRDRITRYRLHKAERTEKRFLSFSFPLSLSLSLSPSLLSSMALANPQTRPFCPVVRPGFINHGTLINRETLPRNQDGTKPFVSVLSVLARGETETSMETKPPRRPCVAEWSDIPLDSTCDALETERYLLALISSVDRLAYIRSSLW